MSGTLGSIEEGLPIALAEVIMSHDQFDVSLEDSDLLSEVELTTNLIVAATEYERHLTDREIDQILDVVPESRPEA
jgi:hypothetical protein